MIEVKKNLVLLAVGLLALLLVSGCTQEPAGTDGTGTAPPNDDTAPPATPENGDTTPPVSGDGDSAGTPENDGEIGGVPPTPPGFDIPTAKEFTVEGFEFGYSPETITVNEGDTVRVTFKNIGNIGHNFVVDEFNAATRIISPVTEETIEFVASQKGTFAFYCSVGNHRQLGMEGQLVVE